jgi:2-phospho-L-lactate guanylyltransferase
MPKSSRSRRPMPRTSTACRSGQVRADRVASALAIWAVVPVKETLLAKQRLAALLPASLRREFAISMFEDVLQALAAVRELAGMAVITVDPLAAAIAQRFGACVWTEGARDGHTAAVTAAARRLAGEDAALLTLPGDVPLVSPSDLEHLLDRHREIPGFTIVPARDERGSNAIVCSPADLVPLRFGADSFFPHLAAARARGVNPNTVYLPRIALDIDEPKDLAEFMKVPSATRARALLEGSGLGAACQPAMAADRIEL